MLGEVFCIPGVMVASDTDTPVKGPSRHRCLYATNQLRHVHCTPMNPVSPVVRPPAPVGCGIRSVTLYGVNNCAGTLHYIFMSSKLVCVFCFFVLFMSDIDNDGFIKAIKMQNIQWGEYFL